MIRICSILALLLLTACEETVEVVLQTDRAYTIYGQLSVRKDTQAVRIYAIDKTIDVVRPEPLDARVESRNLGTGQIYSWRDSVIQFDKNHFGHVFWARFTPEYEEHHRLEVTRRDGMVSSIDLHMPPEAIPKLTDPLIRPGFVYLPILWRKAPRLNNIRVRYYTNKGIFLIKYPNEQQNVESGQIAEIMVHEDVRQVFREIYQAQGSTADARLYAIEQVVLVSSSDWIPPSNQFSADLLIEPGTFSNVKNGFGYVGAGYESTFYYEVPDSVAVAAGFSIR